MDPIGAAVRFMLRETCDTQPGVTARPAVRSCKVCGARCFAALPELMSETVYTDPAPITNYGELQAITQGRRTFVVIPGVLMDMRFSFDINDLPAERARCVFAEHRCHTQPPQLLPEFLSSFGVALNARAAFHSEQIPF